AGREKLVPITLLSRILDKIGKIVKERGEPACGRAAPEGEPLVPYGASKLRGLSFAACGSEKYSS
ncbi:hypothetical protein KKA09_02285, partial [Patescibacteria group bacterium]|nr:hypothetical protein [Patescibacteria group bacterium]